MGGTAAKIHPLGFIFERLVYILALDCCFIGTFSKEKSPSEVDFCEQICYTDGRKLFGAKERIIRIHVFGGTRGAFFYFLKSHSGSLL